MNTVENEPQAAEILNPMGEARKEALRFGLDSQVKLESHGVAVNSDAGLVEYREFDEVSGRTATANDMFRDPRLGKNMQHDVRGLSRKGAAQTLALYSDDHGSGAFPGAVILEMSG